MHRKACKHNRKASSETCSCDHLYSETTSILLPLFRDHLYSITSIQRPPLSNYLYSETTSILLPLFRDHLYSITSIQRPPLFYYLYSETTSILLPLFRDHLYPITSIQRPPLFYILAMHAWSGFTVLLYRILNNGMYVYYTFRIFISTIATFSV